MRRGVREDEREDFEMQDVDCADVAGSEEEVRCIWEEERGVREGDVDDVVECDEPNGRRAAEESDEGGDAEWEVR